MNLTLKVILKVKSVKFDINNTLDTHIRYSMTVLYKNVNGIYDLPRVAKAIAHI